MNIKENEQTRQALERAKTFCEFFGLVNIENEPLKKNLKTTAKGLEQALVLLEQLDKEFICA